MQISESQRFRLEESVSENSEISDMNHQSINGPLSIENKPDNSHKKNSISQKSSSDSPKSASRHS